MFLDSGFAPPVPAFPFPVALVNTDPDASPLISVCFNREWLPYVVTCLYQLTLQATWDTNDPDALNLVQARAMTLISNFIQGCNPPNPQAQPGAGGDEDFMLRQNPDNPCELQFSVDGTHWCTWADLSLCKPAVTQPGGGAEQPAPGGGQECYHAIMQASEQWNVPTVVNAGDQIVFSNVKGAGADGGIDGLWYCPNGQTFFAGACIGVPGTKNADIANTIPHMRLIVNVGGTWYDAYDTSFTVPGGVTNSPVIVQINDSNIADNSGSYQFDVCVTNHQTAQWCYTFTGVDLALWTQSGGGDAGQGWGTFQNSDLKWHTTCAQYNSQAYEAITIEKSFAVTGALTQVEVYYSVSNLGPVNGFSMSSGATTLFNSTAYGSSPFIWTGSFAPSAPLKINMSTGHTNNSSVCPGSSGTISKIILKGTGTNPFGQDNC